MWKDYYDANLFLFFDADCRALEEECQRAMDLLIPWHLEVRNFVNYEDYFPIPEFFEVDQIMGQLYGYI